MPRRLLAGLLSAALAGCTIGSTNSAGPAGTTTEPNSASASVPATTSTLPTSGAVNLRVTDAVRAQLVTAGAALRGLPTSDFVGLIAGRTYYAYDADTNTYWAGAALDPAPGAYQAQVASQDDGSYLIFHRPAGGSWTATQTGSAGLPGSTCPVQIPNAVLSVWNWGPGTCDPPASQYPGPVTTTT